MARVRGAHPGPGTPLPGTSYGARRACREPGEQAAERLQDPWAVVLGARAALGLSKTGAPGPPERAAAA